MDDHRSNVREDEEETEVAMVEANKGNEEVVTENPSRATVIVAGWQITTLIRAIFS